MAGHRYDDAPYRLDEFVSIDEVNLLLQDQGKYLAKDYRRTEHFLHRVHTTLLGVRNQIQKLHRDVQAAQIRATTAGAPTTLDPRSAARFLPPEELAALADELIREKFSSLKRMEGELNQSRSEVTRRVQLLKFALVSLEEDPAVPADVKDRVATAMRAPMADIDTYLAAELAAHLAGASSPTDPPAQEAPVAPPPYVPTVPAAATDDLDSLFD
jgi:hypothetical protein